ncbi:hypothetical protein AAG570_001854 [Ranatra chinensis]|uniref:MYND-type domain-containing protein n=1 Tax=Ranatra chinensis TaxID=642074 RepID=A0ABD0YBN8_9HEMI
MQVDAFYSTTCNECKRIFSTEVPARRCSGCKLVSYCSRDHQKLNWSRHKELCRRAQLVLSQTGKENVFQAVGNSKNWWDVRIKAMFLVERTGVGPLLPYHREVFIFPDACRVCYATYPILLKPCPVCHTVTYCSDEHRLSDYQSHVRVCSALKFGMEVDISIVTSSFELTSLPSNTLAIQDTRPNLPANMEEFIVAYFTKTDNRVATVLLSEILTCVTTLMHTIEKSGDYFARPKLTLHILGPKQLEYSLFETLEILFHLYNCLKHLEIVFIGPECPPYPQNISLCAECLASRTATVDVRSSMMYHDYLSCSDSSVPDLIIAFNCGLHEFEGDISDTWIDSIPSFMSFCNTLIVLTSYNKLEAAKDMKRVLSVEQPPYIPRVIIECEENPFRGLRPHREWEHNTDSVFYLNNVISVIETCPP